jgi:hypothetical protein
MFHVLHIKTTQILLINETQILHFEDEIYRLIQKYKLLHLYKSQTLSYIFGGVHPKTLQKLWASKATKCHWCLQVTSHSPLCLIWVCVCVRVCGRFHPHRSNTCIQSTLWFLWCVFNVMSMLCYYSRFPQISCTRCSRTYVLIISGIAVEEWQHNFATHRTVDLQTTALKA